MKAEISIRQQILEELEALRKERDHLESELGEAKTWNQDMDDMLDERQKELQREEKKRAHAERQLQECRKELRDHKTQATRVQRELEQSTHQLSKKLEEKQKSEQRTLKQLNQARDHIFKLQPRRMDITETEAQEQFEDLYNRIHRWVTNRLEGILDELESGQLRNRPFAKPGAKRFLGLNSARATQNMWCDQSDEFIVIAAIMRFLCRAFFNQSFYCPLRRQGEESDAAHTIDRIEAAMRGVPRGTLSYVVARGPY